LNEAKQELAYRQGLIDYEKAVNRGDLVLGIMESGSLSFTEKEVAYDLDRTIITVRFFPGNWRRIFMITVQSPCRML